MTDDRQLPTQPDPGPAADREPGSSPAELAPGRRQTPPLPPPTRREPSSADVRARRPDYRGEELDPERGPGLGCFWFQMIVLGFFIVIIPVGLNLNWPFELLALLLFVVIGLLLVTGQTVIFLLRLVAADRRSQGRRRPLASQTKTVGELEDELGPADAAPAADVAPAEVAAPPADAGPAEVGASADGVAPPEDAAGGPPAAEDPDPRGGEPWRRRRSPTPTPTVARRSVAPGPGMASSPAQGRRNHSTTRNRPRRSSRRHPRRSATTRPGERSSIRTVLRSPIRACDNRPRRSARGVAPHDSSQPRPGGGTQPVPVLATFFNVRRGRDSFFKFFMRTIFPRQVRDYEEKFGIKFLGWYNVAYGWDYDNVILLELPDYATIDKLERDEATAALGHRAGEWMFERHHAMFLRERMGQDLKYFGIETLGKDGS